ncbi:MAG: FAD-binding oxidoreductase, partial [Dehalococcoidia bacterium]
MTTEQKNSTIMRSIASTTDGRSLPRSRIILPGDAGYDAARIVHNGVYDRRPALIVRAENSADVIAAIQTARDQGLPLAVRGGGHSFSGLGTVDDGLVIDLSHMKGLTIDPERRVARAEPGLTWGEYAAQAQMYGLATSSGDTSSVGVGGLTLGGGIGWLARKHGLTIDHLLAAEVVTADGRLLRVSERENADLFWAIRGGGGNFGVATAFEFRLHPVGTVLGGMVAYPGADLKAVLRAWAAFMAEAPDELTTTAWVMQAPPAPFIPTA